MNLAEKKTYTYADMLNWDESVRAEIIDGTVYMMAGASRSHQRVSGEIFRQLANYLHGKSCEVYDAPFDVRLFEKSDVPGERIPPERVDTVVEPDIFVICDSEKLDERGCKGAPDLIIEVLSPSTKRYDRETKFRLYERAGVREYWLVDPETRTVCVFRLERDPELAGVERYVMTDLYVGAASVPVGVLDSCAVDFSTVFA